MAMPTFHLPESLEETLGLLSTYQEDTRLLAGGTALMTLMRSGLVAPEHVIGLGRLEGLDYVQEHAGVVRMGALTTLRSLERNRTLRATLPTLVQAISLVANVRVRNMATIGGNLSEADYASDPPAVLLACGARVRLLSARSERWVPLSDLLVNYYETCIEPSELLVEVEVPVPSPTANIVYLKLVTRSAEDRPCAGIVAFVVVDSDNVCTDLRIAVGAVQATPYRLPEAEASCVGRPLDPDTIASVARDYADGARPLSDVRGSGDYRREMVRVLVARAVGEAASGKSGARRV